MSDQSRRALRLLLSVLAGAAGLWVLLRFLLPWLAPFLVAMALASLLEPGVRMLIRHGWRRGLAAGLLTLLLVGLLFWGLAELGGRCLTRATALARELPALMQTMAQTLSGLEERLLSMTDAVPGEVREYLDLALDSLAGGLSALPLQLSQRLLGVLSRAAQSAPDVMLFAVTAGLGTFFLSSGFPKSMAFLRAQVPESLAQRLQELKADLKGSFGGLLRAQLLLMGLTFLELLPALKLLGVSDAAGLAVLTALVDALPVFGTGTVLLPWAAAELLLGSGGRALGLAACWAGTNLVRNCVQAKLLGDQIGLNPTASLLAVYVGWRICGVGGMLLFPVLLSTLQQLNDRGTVKLWRTV